MSGPGKSRPRRAAAAAELPPLGAHMSIAGGVDKAIERARSAGCTALQIFLKNNNRWQGRALAADEVERFRDAVAAGDLGRPVAHASYLVNLGTPDALTADRGLLNLVDDIGRADALGVPGIVLHPGAHMGSGETRAIRAIARRLERLFRETARSSVAIYLETTAGQGSAVGYRFEHLRDLLDAVEQKNRLGVCLDTCHVFAAGYDLRTPAAVQATMEAFDRVVGVEWLRVVHVNDSRRELGSRVDRHAHIGKGEIGSLGFAALIQERRLGAVPWILETPKEKDLAEDRRDLATLRRLARRRLA